MEIVGCVASWRWCDVVARRYRGWVYARYLAYRHDGSQARILAGGPALGLPSIDFGIASYWDEHYRDQRWYGRKLYWQDRCEKRRPAPE